MIQDQRTDLTKAFPLAVPFSVIVEPTNLCNFRCVYCPTSDPSLLKRFGVPKGSMDMDLYRSVLDGIADLLAATKAGRIKKLLLYKDGEPLLNPNLPQMAAVARDMELFEEIWITTNGAFLTPSLARELFESGVNGIRISVVALSAAGYRRLAGVNYDPRELMANLKLIIDLPSRGKILVKMIDAGLSAADKSSFHEFFGPIADGCFLEEVTGWSLSREKDCTMGIDMAEVASRRGVESKEVCASPFYSLAVNHNGTVSTCCVDWGYKTLVGNLNYQTFAEVWQGPKLREFRRMQLEKRRRENPACADCDYMATHPDQLDHAAEKMLELL